MKNSPSLIKGKQGSPGTEYPNLEPCWTGLKSMNLREAFRP